jgi:chromate transport protein ChrA
VGTLAFCAPSLVCINLMGAFWERNREHPCMTRVFGILRPVVTGLVITAAVLLVLESLWGGTFREALRQVPDLRAAALVAAAFTLTAFTRVSPMYVLLGGAAMGMGG